ncbi:subtilisin-like protease SBT4.15 [Impatiens glandulifera]|uniref:subtilisin-like protease SBT4.15 n=1 Tax=Impatiens glandulifera TaxID=253017 RepID=UPI001FB08D3C|nr:subtilisin-like protease SBT4.15 [Impatiens glandulifera]
MKNPLRIVVLFNVFLSTIVFVNCFKDFGHTGTVPPTRQPYIVYMGEKPEALSTYTATISAQQNILSGAIGDPRVATESMIYNYWKSFNGFAANLLPHEASILLENSNVVSVFPSKVWKLHTTRSWDFIGMPLSIRRKNTVEAKLIIGVLDTGIWVDSLSFNDTGYGPPPSKWKGECTKNALNFTGCNNKIIGASYYNLNHIAGPTDILSPIDTNGHGTHTSSIAAGSPVSGASLYGLAKGTARGGAPSSHLAMYKVCWEMGCSDMDILAGFDAAISDGVDIISVSIGTESSSFFEDSIAIGSFHAMKKGILTSCSAGNSGPALFTVQNVAPWIVTVAASSIDRQFKTDVKLGNGMVISGTSINTFIPNKQMYPLTNGANTVDNNSSIEGLNVSACDRAALNKAKVAGKIVYCLGNDGFQSSTIKDFGGVGTIMSDDPTNIVASTFSDPAAVVNIREGSRIDHYINTTKDAKAVIYKSKTSSMNAPFIASFSSRGPQTITPCILKPDLAAPGLNILAGFSPVAPMSSELGDTRRVSYNIESGTSMACPHVSGAAAYVKSFHPDWSPAAIKSALMTTATPMKVRRQETELGAGSGQIDPRKALNPGLIYDLTESSYISFLCKEGYNSSTIMLLTSDKLKDTYNCSNYKEARGSDGLNYPSLHFQLLTTDIAAKNFSVIFHRTVTNVGKKQAIYNVKVNSTQGLNVEVTPDILKFNNVHHKLSFKVEVHGMLERGVDLKSATLVWTDSRHHVTSPIVVSRMFA